MRWVLLATCALALAGCQTSGEATPSANAATAGAPPANYRQLAADYVKSSFKDPYSIRDAEIAPPKPGTGPSLNSDGFTTPWVVCLRANAKNSMGAYTGRKVTALALSNEKVVNAWDETQYSRMVCEGVAYTPFPEIEEKRAAR
ncbi:hypothetical protein [Bradyrhizobium sp. DOA9]|uniref:hypothetical protein n=1 Tax=Bradyrhizobium sp. DOA9 TaxID=1126627 RepID=UPI0004690AE8|nr:hypothetical protein [Bradyrhizobium sp. DOA9]